MSALFEPTEQAFYVEGQSLREMSDEFDLMGMMGRMPISTKYSVDTLSPIPFVTGKKDGRDDLVRFITTYLARFQKLVQAAW